MDLFTAAEEMNKPKIEEFIKGHRYKIQTSIAHDVWEERVVDENTDLRFIANEIKVRRVKNV